MPFPGRRACQYATEPLPLSQIIPSCVKISRRRLRQLESIHLIREQRQTGKQELLFNARPFVLCGIPLRPLREDQLAYKRQNGKFFLHIVAHPDFGVPMVSADCTCALLTFWLGRNLPPFPPAAWSAT